MSITYEEERVTAEEYIDFLKRTNLGSQYPKERFHQRIEKLVKNVSISLVARNEENKIVGVLFGLTDFSYWLYVTDLGVDRDYEGQGIGRKLMATAHEPITGLTAWVGIVFSKLIAGYKSRKTPPDSE